MSLFSFNKSSLTISVSLSPLMIWLQRFFLVHCFEQNLHVFINSQSAITKLSKDLSDNCCSSPMLHHLIHILICYTRMPWTTAFGHFICSSLTSRLGTVASISSSLDKHNVNVKALTCLTVSSFTSPDKLLYKSHCVCHTINSVPQRSHLGMPPR